MKKCAADVCVQLLQLHTNWVYMQAKWPVTINQFHIHDHIKIMTLVVLSPGNKLEATQTSIVIIIIAIARYPTN